MRFFRRISPLSCSFFGNKHNIWGGIMGEEMIRGQENKQEQSEEVRLLTEICKNSKRTLIAGYVTAGACALMAVILGVSAAMVIPRVGALMGDAQKSLESVNQLAEQASESLEQVNSMSGSITSTSEKLSTMIDDNMGLMNETLTSISEVDFEGLNKGIADFQKAVEPLAGVGEKLSGFSLFGR